MMATDLADYLVSKGIPFRETHSIAGKAVRAAGERKIGLGGNAARSVSGLCPAFEADVYQVFDPMKSVEKRNAIGGTSPQSVKNQIKECRKNI